MADIIFFNIYEWKNQQKREEKAEDLTEDRGGSDQIKQIRKYWEKNSWCYCPLSSYSYDQYTCLQHPHHLKTIVFDSEHEEQKVETFGNRKFGALTKQK